jgi:hypothetical protein
MIPRADAAAEPVAADRAYTVHLEREGVRQIVAVSATRSRKAPMAEAGGPCRCTSSANATRQHRETPAGRAPMRSARPERKSGGCRHHPGGPLSVRRGQWNQRANPWRRGYRGADKARQQRGEVRASAWPQPAGGSQGNAVESVLESSCRVTAPRHQDRPDRSAWLTHWLPPRTPTSS